MKWTLVTGGAKNLGAVICLELARQGYSVVIHYQNSEENAQSIAREYAKYNVRAEYIQGDFSTEESTQEFFRKISKEYSKTQNVINNVGNYFVGSSLKIPLDQWYQLFQTNLHPLISSFVAFCLQ